jgi:hypothetical protein
MNEDQFKQHCLKEFTGTSFEEFGTYYLGRVIMERGIEEYNSIHRFLNTKVESPNW